MLIKILYVILVLSTVALLGAGIAIYVRVRRHMAASKAHESEAAHEVGTPGGKS